MINSHLHKNDTLRQLIRFLVGGGITTLLYTAVYSVLAGFHFTSEQVANLSGFAVAMASGYFIHSLWSFRGHSTAPSRASWRFVTVALLSYFSNTAWVFLLTDHRMLDGAWWWPLIPVVLVTPLVNYTLNRIWVFR